MNTTDMTGPIKHTIKCNKFDIIECFAGEASVGEILLSELCKGLLVVDVLKMFKLSQCQSNVERLVIPK